jgi:TolA-binding protein
LLSKPGDALPPELAWSWTYWLGQSKAALGDLSGALEAATNLVQIARENRDDERLAGSLNLRADWLEKSQLTNEALADYEENLAGAKTPPEYQRQAILKIAELLTAQRQFTDAENRLYTFQQQFPGSAALPAALFTLGDLHLKQYAAQGAATNLALAQAYLDQFLGTYTNSDFLGHACLDRGWCDWLLGNYTAAAADFQTAATLLPRSLDQAVAHFKLGDALYQVNDYANALENYRSVVDNYLDVPGVLQKLDEPALYQSLRVSEAMGNTAAAQAALDRILKWYPAGNLADNADLLFGENEASLGRPEALAAARDLFRQFVKDFPHSELLPQAELAVARTYEQETNWLAAITNYESWLRDFPESDLRSEAIYSAARARYQAGDDTNALAQFTGFITGFPTNDLAPQAQWWVADYLFRTGNFAGAETNYENIFQNPAWKKSPLIYAAQFMAGRAAMGRNGYPDATRYFSTLISDTNCPMDLGIRARFACAAAWMQIPSADTNSPAANFGTAITFLNQIVQLNPTNNDAARAWGEIGNCNFQMSDFDAAETSYEQVFGTNAPALAGADVSARSAAMIGYGLALEKQADAAAGMDRTNLLQAALGKYLDVFDMNLGKNLRDGEQANPFWIKKAGLQALPLIELLGCGDPDKFINQMEELLPNLKDSLEKTRLSLPTQR